MSSGESAKVGLVCQDSLGEETGGSGVQGYSHSELEKSAWATRDLVSNKFI